MNVSRTGAKPREKEILSALSAAVDQMDEVAAVAAARDALSSGLDAYLAITQGLSAGMALVSDKYEKGIYFVPEILLCADAMYAAIDVLRPYVKVPKGATRAPVIIGVIEGDIHDIGKSIVKLMLESAGFTVHDLGGDVPVKAFIAKARELRSGIIAVSTLMSTTMPGMARLIDALKAEGLRDSFKVMIGGGPVSSAFARKIGADAYGANAMEGVRIAIGWQEARP